MSNKHGEERWQRWRLPVMALVAALILVLPSLVLQRMARDSAEAANWVAHTQQVGVRLYNLQADIREVESAALTLSKGLDTPVLRNEQVRHGAQSGVFLAIASPIILIVWLIVK